MRIAVALSFVVALFLIVVVADLTAQEQEELIYVSKEETPDRVAAVRADRSTRELFDRDIPEEEDLFAEHNLLSEARETRIASREESDRVAAEEAERVRVAAQEAERVLVAAQEAERVRVAAEAQRASEKAAAERLAAATTAAAPAPAPAPAQAPRTAPSGVWDQLAACESGGNWAANTGNGYYGGLQFLPATWTSVGGSGLPHENSREEQINRGHILQSRSGWGQWPACSRKLGLR